MTTLSTLPESSLKIRPVKYRDLDEIANLLIESLSLEPNPRQEILLAQVKKYQSCYGLLYLTKLFPIRLGDDFYVYVAEKDGKIQGLIQVSPFNKTRTTWQVEQVLINYNTSLSHLLIGNRSIGSQLLRYCFEKIWEARTWVLEVEVNEKNSLGLYRENGFQPLAQITYWGCTPAILAQLAEQEPKLPNLLPVSDADSHLLYQLDCVSLPPLLRQVFDRHIEDFKTGFFPYLTKKIKAWLTKEEEISAYVFETQRKAAIGYFKLKISHNGQVPHTAELTVHPAYTWLYRELLSQMASVLKCFPPQSLLLSSADYQSEREEFLEKLGAERIEQNLLMSRSVWHKLRESRPLESLGLPEVLQGLKPVHNPIPTPWAKSLLDKYEKSSDSAHNYQDRNKLQN